MKFFLNNYLKRIDDSKDFELLVHLKDLNFEYIDKDIIFKEWFFIYNSLVKKSGNKLNYITVIQAFNVMRNFLERHINKLKINNILIKFMVNSEQIPLEYDVTYAWMHSAYKIILTELVSY